MRMLEVQNPEDIHIQDVLNFFVESPKIFFTRISTF